MHRKTVALIILLPELTSLLMNWTAAGRFHLYNLVSEGMFPSLVCPEIVLILSRST
jgi:hypothetical protein